MTAVEVAPGALLGPLWRRARFWVALGGLLLLGALAIAALSPAPGRALDPSSPAKEGSKALAQLLRGYGIQVERTTRLAEARQADRSASVLVVAPDEYSTSQLASLLAGPARVVLLAPAARALAVEPALEAQSTVAGETPPGCAAAGPVAAGPVEFADGTRTYRAADRDATACYDGALVIRGRLAVLGSARLLRNDAVAGPGVAALDVNVLTADRSLDRVVWLLPGADADGAGAPTVWDLFPAGAHRAFWWLLLAGVVLVLWQARRLGPPVAEPLPVVVRAAEVVEGHGRLYRRGGARHRAAAALRAGTAGRLTRHVGLPRGATAAEIAAVVAPATGADAAWVHHLLTGPPPVDDTELLRLAAALRELERAAGVPPEEEG